MTRRPQTVTDAELAVLKVLWQRAAQRHRRLPPRFIRTAPNPSSPRCIPFCSGWNASSLSSAIAPSFVHSFSASVSQAEVVGQELSRCGTLRLGGVAP